MEKIPEIKKESGVNRIVGAEEQTEKELLAFFKKKFESGLKDDICKKHSIELDNLIPKLNKYLREFLVQYGINSVDVPADKIYIVDNEKLTPAQIEFIKKRLEKVGGVYLPYSQEVGMLIDYENSKKVAFLQALIHEKLHLNSFISFEKLSGNRKEQGHKLTKESASGEEESISLDMRRMGFRIKAKDGKIYFYDTDEAIITELEMRFDWKYFSQFPELEPELKKRQEAINEESRRSGKNKDELKRHFASMEEWYEEDTGQIVQLNGYSYSKEREALNDLIDEIYEKNKSDFGTREDVFAVFAKASMTGRLLPVARLIEKTFGRGSFRALGEKFSQQLAE